MPAPRAARRSFASGAAPAVLAAALLGAGAAADEPEEEYWTYYRTETEEDVVHIDMAERNYVSGFETWYPVADDDSLRRHFSPDYLSTRHSSYVSEDLDLSAYNHLFGAQADQTLLLDTTPRLEVDLSRAFRARGYRWLFICAEIRWPIFWVDLD